MATVTVQLPVPSPIPYDVRVEPGLLSQVGSIVRALTGTGVPSCGLISDTHVAPLYLPTVRSSLEAAGFRVIDYVFPAGEEHKTMATTVAGLDRLLNSRVERGTPIVALGGGVVGDLSGFIAATLLRGVPLVQVPTTLLSAVDASVGGKVGVDHPAGKNLIGAFWQPRAVLTDVATFRTLPPREIRCGLAECIKHAVIRDAALFDFLAANMPRLLANDPNVTRASRPHENLSAPSVSEGVSGADALVGPSAGGAFGVPPLGGVEGGGSEISNLKSPSSVSPCLRGEEHAASLMAQLVAWNVRIKAAIVMADPFEKGIRALLNYGHTFGHALEVVTGYSKAGAGLQHGEAVALGMIAAAHLAERMGKLSSSDVVRISQLIAATGLPLRVPDLSADALLTAMGTDKKVAHGQLRFVIPTAIGQAEVCTNVPPDHVRAALQQILET